MIGAVHRRRWLAVLAVLVMALAAGCTTAAKQEAEVVTRVVSRNGVTLRVPATLRDAVPSCSPPVEDEVEYGIDHSLACPGVIGRPRPPISTVSFADYGPPGGCQPKGDDAIARCLDSSLDPLGRHTGLLVSRTNKVYVEVASRDLGLVRRILQSARTVDQVDGC
ncbi:MAG: hypothetical protein JWO12_709, partial [Frankiales bacterium]|nr:hypothetical protein [Frankiales bacterium]